MEIIESFEDFKQRYEADTELQARRQEEQAVFEALVDAVVVYNTTNTKPPSKAYLNPEDFAALMRNPYATGTRFVGVECEPQANMERGDINIW